MIVISSLQIRRGTQVLVDNASFTITPGQKVGIVGKNGCGKSTLFSLLKGEFSQELGTVEVPKQWTLSWVNQETPALETSAIDYVVDGDRAFRKLEQALHNAILEDRGYDIATIHSQLDTINAWDIQSRAAALLNGLGFSQEELNKSVSTFSGGWRMRLNLAQALICPSDLLLLDEPTNHLDLTAIFWLEKWLKNYTGTLLLISHDRDFLDPITNKILHIDDQDINEYTGNYSQFERMRAEKLLQQNALYRQQQNQISHLKKYIDRFKAKASKAKQAQSRIKMLERMELISAIHADNPFNFQFKSSEKLPNPLLKMDKVTLSYGDKIVLKSIKLNLVPGSRIGLLGKNGAGKSTLIKLLSGELLPQGGDVQLYQGVQLGYFAQHQLETLNAKESPIQHLRLFAPKEIEQNLRNYLGSFDFRGDKVYEATEKFSGGEKARLVLALIVWQRPNLLLLDEPTNHLDLEMRQALTDALLNFEGALLIVSHDRYLLRSTIDEFYLINDGEMAPFDGDLDDYQKWLTTPEDKTETISMVDLKKTPATSIEKKEQKRRNAELRQQLAPLKKQLSNYEKNLDYHQKTLFQIETRLAQPECYEESHRTELNELLQKQTREKKQVDHYETLWLETQKELDMLSESMNS